MQAEQQSEREALCAQITAYLSGGGLWNPELADHIVVRDMLIACRAALSHQSPQGWQTVPVEPTPEMLNAMGETDGTPDRLLKGIWRDALNAAPQPPVQGGSDA